MLVHPLLALSSRRAGVETDGEGKHHEDSYFPILSCLAYAKKNNEEAET